MLNWLRFRYIAIVIIFIAGCAAGTAQQPSQASIDFDEIKSAKADCDFKAQQFTSLKRECIASKDPACVAKLELLASEMQHDFDSLLGKSIHLSSPSVNSDMRPLANTSAAICGERACRATLETADTYSAIGDKENAKRVYREVIASFTGTIYTGFVKKAEFALEDLKAAQQK